MAMNFNRIESNDKVLIMEGAQVLGDVVAGEGTAFWYNSVCRGELQSVRIGKRCNIQDLALIHNKVTIGDDVSVGHSAIVHGATIGNRVIVGMGATILDGAVIGNDCIIGAGALVTGKMNAPDGSMILGSPAKVVRELTEKERESILANAKLYLEKSEEYRATLQSRRKLSQEEYPHENFSHQWRQHEHARPPRAGHLRKRGLCRPLRAHL